MRELHGYLLVATAAILWGSMGILAKIAYVYGINPPTLIAFRLLTSSLTTLLLAFILKRDAFKIQKAHILQFVLFGVFAVALQRLTYFYAVDLTTVTIAVILFYTYPIFVTIYGHKSKGEKISGLTVIAISLTFLGVALVVKAYETSWINANLPGIIAGLASSLLFVQYFIQAKELRKNYTNWTLMIYGDTIGALTLTPITFASLNEAINYPLELWLIILAIAWIPSLLAYLIYSYAIKHVEYSKGSILGVLEPLSAAILSTIILKESLTAPQIVGMVMTLTGVTLPFLQTKTNEQTQS